MTTMKKCVLAVDCSLRLTGVALGEEERLIASETLDLGRRQAAELPLVVERLVKGAGRSWEDIGLVCVASGPGYFTGIRVGAAYAAALAYGLGVKVVPVPSLELLALSCPDRGAGGVLSVVYAGRGFVYAASFGAVDGLAVGEYPGAALTEWLTAHPGVTAISDDPARAAEAAALAFPLRAVRPDASVLPPAAWRRGQEAVAPAEMRAVYCRAPQGTV